MTFHCRNYHPAKWWWKGGKKPPIGVLPFPPYHPRNPIQATWNILSLKGVRCMWPPCPVWYRLLLPSDHCGFAVQSLSSLEHRRRFILVTECCDGEWQHRKRGWLDINRNSRQHTPMINASLKQAIENSGGSRNAIAKATGVNRLLIDRWIRGWLNIGIDKAELLCEHLALELKPARRRGSVKKES